MANGLHVPDELKARILHKVNELRRQLFGQLGQEVQRYQRADAERQVLEFAATLGVKFGNEDHFRKQYRGWKEIALKKEKGRNKTGAAPIPKLAWEVLIYTIECQNPKFNTARQVTTFSINNLYTIC
jgi:hypothetical protein